MEIVNLVLGELSENCYIVYDEKSKNAIVIDPGDDFPMIRNELSRRSLNVLGIFLTHGHYDHIRALDELIQYSNAAYYIAKSDDRMLHDPYTNCSSISSNPFSVISSESRTLNDADIVDCGFCTVKTISTPGHTAGSVCYLIVADGHLPVLFTGDTLFYLMIGRTDLPSGSPDDMRSSLLKIRELFSGSENDMVIYPGHGRETTLGSELKHNIYIRHLSK